MVSTNALKNGMTLIIDKSLFTVQWFQHVKPGKGGAFVKTKLKNLQSGAVLEKTFRAGEELEQAYLEEKVMEYLYKDGDTLWFMDTQDYEQHPLLSQVVGKGIGFLRENDKVRLTYHQGKVIDIVLPTFVVLPVVETAPGFKGDTVSASYKPATLETGAVVQVPLFVKVGDKLKIDTRTGEYVQRV